jgi:signal transduction histidine kinase
VDALNKAVHEVIRLARRPAADGEPSQCDLGLMAQERVAYWRALAEDTGRPLIWRGPDAAAPVPVPPTELRAMLDTLLENAFTHTPDDATVRVEVTLSAGAARLLVSDDGPGFAVAPERGVSGGDSTGLGLDIARQTARGAGGSLEWGSGPNGGAEVVVTLPIRTAAEARSPA